MVTDSQKKPQILKKELSMKSVNLREKNLQKEPKVKKQTEGLGPGGKVVRISDGCGDVITNEINTAMVKCSEQRFLKKYR